MLKFLAFIILLDYAICDYNLTIVHVNDFHSHWFEFNEYEKKCSDEESVAGKCFGGFPRLVRFVNDKRAKEKNVIVLSSGEFFLGRSLNALHGWKLANVMLPNLELDAMSLANHDFSSGIFELSAFLYGLKCPVLCANMWARETSFMYSRVNKSIVLDVSGEKIGIIGYVHPETLERARKAGSVKFYPEIPAIEKEVKRLESEGINKIIALGHSGYYTDLEIAKTVKGVDVVIGGNSDIVLKKTNDNGPTSTEGNIHGNYPRIHYHENDEESEQNRKNKTLVLHMPPHGKYVGIIRVSFDDAGKIIHQSGEPVLLDNKIKEDKEVLKILQATANALEEVSEHRRLPHKTDILAVAKGDFESLKCRMEECTLGNLVSDAMLYTYMSHEQEEVASTEYEKWGYVDAVLFNSGAVRYPLLSGNIFTKDLLHSLFLGDLMKRTQVSGAQLKKIMEQSVRNYDSVGVTAPGSFLQLSGMRVVYDLSQKPGNRVQNLTIRCKFCSNSYFPVKSDQTYIVAMPGFIAEGGDGYPESKVADPQDFGQMEILLIIEYLQAMEVVSPVLDGRISFINKPMIANLTASRRWNPVNQTSLVKPDSTDLSNSAKKNVEYRQELNGNKSYVYGNKLTGHDSATDSSKLRLSSESVSLQPRNIDTTAPYSQNSTTSSQKNVPQNQSIHLNTVLDEQLNQMNIIPLDRFGLPIHDNEVTETLFINEEDVFKFRLKEQTTQISKDHSTESYTSTPAKIATDSSNGKVSPTPVSEVLNSTLGVLEKILIDAMLAEAKENSVLMDKENIDSLGSSLKLTLKNFLKARTQVTHLHLSQISSGTNVKFNTTTEGFVLDLISYSAAQNVKNETSSSASTVKDGNKSTVHFSGKIHPTFHDLSHEDGQNRSEIYSGPVYPSITQFVSKSNLTNVTSNNFMPSEKFKETETVHDILVNSIVNSVLEKALIKARHISKTMELSSLSYPNNKAMGVLKSENNTEEIKMSSPQDSTKHAATKVDSTTSSTVSNNIENDKMAKMAESSGHSVSILNEAIDRSESDRNSNKAEAILIKKSKKKAVGGQKYFSWFPWLL